MLSRYRSVSVVNADDINPVIQFEEAAEYRCWRGTRADDKGLGALRTALRLWDGPLAGIAHQEGQFDAAGATQLAVSSAAATAVTAQPSTVQPSNYRYTEPPLSESAVLTAPGSGPVECGSGGGAGGGRGGWWSLAEAVATPLTWEEVAASLGVASELAADMQPPQRFETKEAFLSHMIQKHISKLEGGEELAEVAAPPPAASDDPWVTRSTPAAAGTATTAAGDEDLEQRQQQRRRAVSAAAALAAAVRQLSGAVVFPAALQVTLGSEALGWNPVPLLWVGRSRRSGAILGLLTAVVWT